MAPDEHIVDRHRHRVKDVPYEVFVHYLHVFVECMFSKLRKEMRLGNEPVTDGRSATYRARTQGTGLGPLGLAPRCTCIVHTPYRRGCVSKAGETRRRGAGDARFPHSPHLSSSAYTY